jgi:hypothetical protein
MLPLDQQYAETQSDFEILVGAFGKHFGKFLPRKMYEKLFIRG